MKQFKQNGGKVIQQKIHDFQDFTSKSSYDVIINCTGLGSQQILPDKKMFPVRGQGN